MSPRPLDLDLSSGEIPLRCPRCMIGRLKLHIRYAPVDAPGLVVAIPQWLRCTRVVNCGYWKPVVSEAAR